MTKIAENNKLAKANEKLKSKVESLEAQNQISQKNYEKLLESFEKLPRITAYMAGDDYIERPINSPWASFC